MSLPANRPARFGIEAALAVNALVIAFAWLYFVSAGFTANGILDGVYEIQADMLRHGHISVVPGPLQVFYHDALMYWGTYYFYWGLLPSCTFFLLSSVLGRLGGHYLTVFLFLCCLTYFFQRILEEVIRAAYEDEIPNAIGACVGPLVLTWIILFVIPYPVELGWFFGRFAVYEQQVLFGLAMAMPGLYYLIRGMRVQSVNLVAVANLFFCLAAWTRVTWFPWAALLLVGTVILSRLWEEADKRGSGLNFSLMAMGTCFLLLVGLMCINEARFGSFTDFGVRHQNPGHYLYFRNLKLFFSPLTKIWNGAFNLMSYYAPPNMVEGLGLGDRSFAFGEGFPPSFFYFNPQFLLLVVLFPLGAYRIVKKQSPLIVPFLCLAVCSLYLQFIVCYFGTFVLLRYFVEFYYITAAVFLCILLMLIRPRHAIPIFVVLLALNFPAAVKSFMSVKPELRTFDPRTQEVTSGQVRTPFVEHKVWWPQGSFSAKDVKNTPQYAAMGLQQAGQDMVLGQDICAVYLIPGGMSEGPSKAGISVLGLRSLAGRGTARFYVEDRLIGEAAVGPEAPVDFRIELPFSLPVKAPYQVMLVFLQEGHSYLPPRTTGRPALILREIALVSHGRQD